MTQQELIELLETNTKVLKTRVYEKYNNIEITDITYDSRNCTRGCAFFAKGKNFKKEYIDSAIENGAMIIISEQDYKDIDVGIVVVEDIRAAMVVVAESFFGQAYKDITMIGLTGTKGKTTTATYVHNILNLHTKKRTALLSTVETYTGKRTEESYLSTPEAIELQRYIKEAADCNLKYLTMEVSSQAIKANRIKDMSYEIGIFLNISEDHISPAEHPNFNDYLNCKLEFLKKCKTIVINYETDKLEAVLDASKNANKIILFGSEKVKDKVDFYYSNIKTVDGLLKFNLTGQDGTKEYNTKIPGMFNVENAVAAILTARQLGIEEENIVKGIEQTTVSGRMNVFSNGEKTVIVDYAHNKLSFERFFESVQKDYPERDIIALFGAPGGKAYGRRKDMAEVASKYATKIYLTADDPQFEKVRDICNELATFITCDYETIENRKQAIYKAFDTMKDNAVLCLLAKGEDKYQQVKGKLEPYESDVAIAKEITNRYLEIYKEKQ